MGHSIPHHHLTKVRSKKEVIDEARTKGAKVHFASLVDICHLKNADLEAKHQKYKGRVVLRGDIEKDDSVSYAVLNEQGSSASHMTAAKVMGYHLQTARVRRTGSGCSIGLYSGQNGRSSEIIENSKIGMSRHWIRLPRHKWPKSWSSMEDPVVPLERNLYCHPLAGLLWERQFDKILLKYGWEKVSNWECLFVHREKGLFLSVYVDDIKLAGKKQHIDPMWKVLDKEVDFGRPNIFPGSRIPGVYSKTMGNKQRYC